ncbi:RFC checkpoint protein Rad17, partial [Linderina pennispora]
QRAADPSSADVGDMWWKQYEPQSVDDLGVHNGKIAQVRGWLEMAMQPAAAGPSAFARILVVEGPAGAGKSTCVRVLAKELGLGVVEWINPLSGRSSVAGALGFDIDEVGVVEQFAAFLKRAERYTPLQLDASGEVSGSRGSAPSTRGQIVLVDDLPNILHRDTRESFRSALLRFISIPARQSFPLVIVVTESFSTQDLLDDASRRSWRLRDDDKSANTEVATWCASDIIPSAVYSSAYCQSIKFNPVAPTIVSKGLKRILQIRQGLEGQKNVRFSPECTAAVKAISSESGGDIRSAITMLQLTQAAYTGMSSQSLTPRKRSRATKLVTGSDVVEGKNVAATRSVSLDLFHALGKVLYAKRGPPGTADSNSGRGRLESSPSQIIGHLPVDVSTFNLFVHENSVDFCGSLDELTEALSYFSDADVVSSRGRTKHDAFETAAEIYSGMLTMHGFMHAKGHPELAGSGVPLHDQASQGSHRSSIQAFRKPMFFESYKKRMYNSRLASGLTAVDLFDLGSNAPTLAAWGGRMIDSLAFWAQIVPRRPGSSSLVRQRNPIVYQQLIDLAMASDRPGPCGQDGTGLAADLPGAVGSARMELQKLVLSDDDIEDFSD